MLNFVFYLGPTLLCPLPASFGLGPGERPV